jgi:hypothetical protein
MKYIFDFHTVGANILHRRGTNAARYEGQVLYAAPAICNTVLYKFVPVLPCPGPHINMISIFPDQINPHDLILHHIPIDIVPKQKITSATQHQNW